MAALSEEQSILRDQAAAWVAEKAPVAKFREMRDAGDAQGFQAAIWREMVELGWTGVIVPEKHGGAGLGYLAFGVLLEQLGRQLVASPLFASAYVGASALTAAGDNGEAARLLPKIVTGDEIVALAVDDGPRHAPDRIALKAALNGDGYRLTGKKAFVAEGMAATTFLVAAGGDDAGLFVVPADAPGLGRSPLKTVDSRGYASLSLDGVEVPKEAYLGDSALLEDVLDRARAGMAAEMLGTGAAAFELTLEYLKEREQFGKVIGSFQTLGHRAAELFSSMELARSCMEAALQALDDRSAESARLAALSKAKVGDFLFEMSNQLIQIHGGIGMTDAFDAGFYLKRARAQEAAFGGRSYQRDRYAGLAGY